MVHIPADLEPRAASGSRTTNRPPHCSKNSASRAATASSRPDSRWPQPSPRPAAPRPKPPNPNRPARHPDPTAALRREDLRPAREVGEDAGRAPQPPTARILVPRLVVRDVRRAACPASTPLCNCASQGASTAGSAPAPSPAPRSRPIVPESIDPAGLRACLQVLQRHSSNRFRNLCFLRAGIERIPYFCKYFHLKTTLDLPDDLMREVRICAARGGRKLKDVIAEARPVRPLTP